jgi:uncharacterized repeat protein (TIGR03803 family)
MCGTCLTAVVAFTANSTAQTKPTLTTLFNFALDAAADGAYLNGGVVIGSGGVLYGTTTYGGAGPCTSTTYGPGCGTVFSLTPPASLGGAWTEAVLYSFNGGSDGANPLAGVVIGGGGVLYGTTSEGGPLGDGTVFSLTPPVSPDGTWTESVLHSFTGVNGDGREPYMGSLAIDGSGALYGMTYAGGTPAGNCSLGCGTVFELAPPASAGGAWTESTIHSFTLENGDGGYPLAGVVIGSGGVLYGASELGGTSAGGFGMVFSLTPPAAPGGAWTESVIYSFTNQNGDGGEPQSDLIIDSGGVLYGTTAFGGDVDSGGTAFSLTPPVAAGGVWTEAVICTFKQENRPQSSLVIGRGGVLYGTTPAGGRHDAGIVFSLRPGDAGVWTPAMLHSFNLNHSGQGLYPIGGVVIGTGGVLYGTTRGSASKGPPSYTHGTVFSLTP